MSTQQQVLGGPTSSLNLQNAIGIKDPHVAAVASRQVMRKHTPVADHSDYWHISMMASLYQFQNQQTEAKNDELYYDVA